MHVVCALGARVRVELNEKIDDEEFCTAWARCLGDHDDEVGPVVTARSGMTVLTQQITRALITQRRGELLMLHAGAVSHPETGRSLVYAAPGGTGKTTLTRLLARRYGYITDETVGIEPETWRIAPYPKPLSFRTDQGGYPKIECGPDGLGLQSGHPEPVVGTVAILRRRPELSSPAVSSLPVLDAITALAPETSSLSWLPSPLHILDRLFAYAEGVHLIEYSEAEHLIEWTDQALGTHS